ncbi:MAG: hypothetical protein ACO1SX_00840 [Actinomycetota bacterium]
MEIVVFSGELKMGDSAHATMVFAQDFRVPECALRARRMTVECAGVQILGAEPQKEISSHPVYLDHTLVGRLDSDAAEFTVLPPVDAGVHRVSIHVSPFPGAGFCDDFLLKKIVFSYKL